MFRTCEIEMNSSSHILQQNLWNSSLGFFPNQTLSRAAADSWLIEILAIKRIVKISFVSLLTVVSLLGNASLLAIFTKYKDMRTTTNLFILNMVISDLLYVVFVVPPVLNEWISLSFEWMLRGAIGVISCKLFYFVRDLTFTVSIVSIVAIALDRFYAVVYPIKRKPKCLSPRFSIPFIWLLSTAPFSIYFYVARLVSHPIQKNMYFCVLIWTPAFDQAKSPQRLYEFIVVAFFLVPLVFITVLYSVIIYKLRKHSIPGIRTSETEKLRRKRNRSITKVGVLIVLCFFFSWTPYHCLNLTLQYLWNNIPPLHLVEFIDWLYFVFASISTTSIASNAFVCYACGCRFRSCLKKMLASCCCHTRSTVGDRSNSERQQVTQSFRLQGNEVKNNGIINKGMSTGQTVESESGWETRL